MAGFIDRGRGAQGSGELYLVVHEKECGRFWGNRGPTKDGSTLRVLGALCKACRAAKTIHPPRGSSGPTRFPEVILRFTTVLGMRLVLVLVAVLVLEIQ